VEGLELDMRSETYNIMSGLNLVLTGCICQRSTAKLGFKSMINDQGMLYVHCDRATLEGSGRIDPVRSCFSSITEWAERVNATWYLAMELQ
jgi:hypothetical protein